MEIKSNAVYLENPQITYYCNGCGETFYWREAKDGDVWVHEGKAAVDVYLDDHDELHDPNIPEELCGLYNRLWTDDSGSLCYIATVNGNPRILLVNEFNSKNMGADGVLRFVTGKAKEFTGIDLFDDTEIAVADAYHTELIVAMKPEITDDTFRAIAEYLYDHAYAGLEAQHDY